MFYAHIILAKKGPLARVWLAAHWDKKITKAHVFETNIEKSVEGIMQPKVKLALRTSGHLLLGVVRIHARKAKYLLADCNEAFVKIKMAFRPGMVDLPEDNREANINAITLPEVFHDFDTELPELNDIDIEAQFSINQSRADEITMREDYGSLSLSLHDDGFGDIGFEGDSPDIIRDHLDPKINDDLFENDGIVNNLNNTDQQTSIIHATENDLSTSHFDEAGFGDGFEQPELFEDDLFGEPPTIQDDPESKPTNDIENEPGEHFSDESNSPAYSCRNSPRLVHKIKDDNFNNGITDKYFENADANDIEQSALIQNEDESFALAPIDASAYKGLTKAKRKRKLIVDEIKNISGEEMKAQLANTSDIVTTLDLAPPTKRLMYWKETGGVEKLFSLPSRPIPARVLYPNYQRHLLSHFASLENFSSLGPNDLLALDQLQNDNDNPVIQSKRGRKRKHEIQAHIHPNESLPEQLRYNENEVALSRLSLNANMTQDVHLNLIEKSDFCPDHSPRRMFTVSNNESADDVNTFNNIPNTPGNMHQVLDSVDDFNNGDLTPAGLNHGQVSPQHVGLDSIESIPNLPVDQISSFFSEAENILFSASRINYDNQKSEWNSNFFKSVPKIPEEQQLENETSEQFEERVLNKRAAQLFYAIKARMISQETLILSDLSVQSTRKMAAQKFYSLLVLKKFGAVSLEQTDPYSEIVIERGPCFDNPKL